MTDNQSIINSDSRFRLLWSQPAILLIGLSGLVLSILLFHYVISVVERITLREFMQTSTGEAANLKEHLDLTILNLNSVRRFFEYSEEVTPEEFQGFVRPILDYSPILVSLRWASRVPAGQWAMWQKEGRMQAVAEHGNTPLPEALYPIQYLEPLVGNGDQIGLPLGAESPYRQAFEKSFQTDLPVLLYPRKDRENSAPFTIEICLPVYKSNPRAAVKPRCPDCLNGFLIGALQLDPFLHSLQSKSIDSFFCSIEDCQSPDQSFWIYNQKRISLPDRWTNLFQPKHHNICYSDTVAFADRTWRIHYQPRANYNPGYPVQMPWIILAIGLLLSSFLMLYLWDLHNRNIRTEQLVRRRTEELREQKQKADKMAEKADRANQAKSIFLANMSHEIRTPMNAILGFAELLCDSPVNSSQKNFLHLILDSGKTLLTLINDILDFSKIEAGKLTVENISCSLPDVLASVKSLLQPAAEKKNLDFKICTKGRLPVEILSDPVRLRQCLINLIGNAIKFTHSGHVHLNVSMDPACSEPMIQFDVEDTGIGISAQRQQEIFEPFTQSDTSTTRHYGGTGLGLTITRRLVELMRGSLSVQSQVGRGSVFTFRIPAGVDLNHLTEKPMFTHALFSESRNQLPPTAEECRFWGRLLVAEDALASQILIRKLLEKYGLEVTVVSDGKQAVEEAISGAYDLIFMDMHMPELNGYDATGLLRDQGCMTPIIALTASAMKGDEDKCVKAGCDGYMSKPIDRRELFNVLQRNLLADPGFKKPYQKTRESSESNSESD